MVTCFEVQGQVLIMREPSPNGDSQAGGFPNPDIPSIDVACLFVEREARPSSQIFPGTDIEKRLL